MWQQIELNLPPCKRGFHLITSRIHNALHGIEMPTTGLLHVFIQHTSASLTINENADPSVRVDMESYFSRLAAENEPYYTHTMEGPDDMPAHLKASILGSSVSVPIVKSELGLGTWQGIYLCEHRDHASGRNLVLTIQGSV